MKGRKKSPGRLYAEDLCAKFPNHGDLTLAKKAYKDSPKLFLSIEQARQFIRHARGHNGNLNRKKTSVKDLFKPVTYNTNPYKLPESHANPWEPFIISQSRVLIISDLHFPYQDNRAITAALNYGKEKNANAILINGDLIDFATISRHERDWRQRSVKEEFDATRTFLVSLRKNFPKARIIYKFGNHDERWEKYLYAKAPEIFDMEEFELENIMRLNELKIEVVKDKRPIKIGKLFVFHGHEFTGGAGGVNPARSTFLKANSSVIVGHYHRTSQHTDITLSQDVISVNSTGCLCELHPHYMPINKHNHGFAYVDHSIKTGEYIIYNMKIVKGKVY